MKWEYKRITTQGNGIFDPAQTLNDLGGEGWELVAVSPATGFTAEVWFFKRRKHVDEDAKRLVDRAIIGDLDAIETVLDVLENARHEHD